jgi:energy-converting hydrogenase Eha subunit E
MEKEENSEKKEIRFESEKEERFAIIDSDIAKLKGKTKSEFRDVVVALIISIVGVVLLYLHYTDQFFLHSFWLVVTWVITVILILFIIDTDRNKTKTDLASKLAVRNVMLRLPDSNNGTSEYFDSLVKINVENLSAYYSLVKAHSEQSFKISLFVGIAGFLLIVSGLVMGFQYQDLKNIGYISTGAGILIEFISGVLFYMYNKTVRQLKEYHDSLINAQNILLSFKLIESIKDESSKSDMIGRMIDKLIKN